MRRMIEVEIRGRLDQAGYEKLKRELAAQGESLGLMDREMFLLRDYPGYEHSITGRDMDIRLRNTNGECEIMVKRKAGEHNAGREEISLKLQDKDLSRAKSVIKALGFPRALKMERVMDKYRLDGTEWQVVGTPKGLWYWEAEREVAAETEVPAARSALEAQARGLGLAILTPQELQEFIDVLDREVNVEVEL